MKLFELFVVTGLFALCNAGVVRRQTVNGFQQGEPINYATGRGAPHSGIALYE